MTVQQLQKIRRLKIIARIFLVMQVISLFGSRHEISSNHGFNYSVGYYIGRSLFLLIALILFAKAAQLKTRFQNNDMDNQINDLGKN
jgi:hypothetical protein